jgi:membrane-associated phospholipid phosphatase
VALTLAAAPIAARADAPTPPPPGRVPLGESFSPADTAAAIAVGTLGVTTMFLAPRTLGSPDPSFGPPAPDSLDARLSRFLYAADGADRRFLWGLPDAAGTAIPLVPALIYGSSTLSLWLRGAPLLPGGDPNPDHRLLAYAEALGWTYLLTGVVKHTVGRPRPYTEGANAHPELRRTRREDNLSFFSGHASGTFAAGAFLARDVSAYLRNVTLADSAPATRFAVGTLLPYTLGYGLPAVVTLSRVIDQQHWPSDVLIGAAAGTIISNLVWTRHFHSDGRPRRRFARILDATRLVPAVDARPGEPTRYSLQIGGRF